MAVDDNKRGFEHLFAYVCAKALDNAEKIGIDHNNDSESKREAFVGGLSKEAHPAGVKKNTSSNKLEKVLQVFQHYAGRLSPTTDLFLLQI